MLLMPKTVFRNARSTFVMPVIDVEHHHAQQRLMISPYFLLSTAHSVSAVMIPLVLLFPLAPGAAGTALPTGWWSWGVVLM